MNSCIACRGHRDQIDLLKEEIRQLKVQLYGDADSCPEMHCTRSEWAVFQFLHKRMGKVVSRQSMMLMLYPDGGSENDKIIDVYISKLRKKISPHGYYVRTVWGRGWMLEQGEKTYHDYSFLMENTFNAYNCYNMEERTIVRRLIKSPANLSRTEQAIVNDSLSLFGLIHLGGALYGLTVKGSPICYSDDIEVVPVGLGWQRAKDQTKFLLTAQQLFVYSVLLAHPDGIYSSKIYPLTHNVVVTCRAIARAFKGKYSLIIEPRENRQNFVKLAENVRYAPKKITGPKPGLVREIAC